MLTRQDNDATSSEERTMRHALVPVQVIHQARPTTLAQARHDAPPEDPKPRRARRRRLTTVARRARTA
jgi:hypothetical protein